MASHEDLSLSGMFFLSLETRWINSQVPKSRKLLKPRTQGMHNICYLIAQPRALSSWRKMLWALPDRRKKPTAPFWSKMGVQENSFSCDSSAAMNLDLESIWLQACMSALRAQLGPQSGAWQVSSAAVCQKPAVLDSWRGICAVQWHSRQGSKRSFPWGPNPRSPVSLL